MRLLNQNSVIRLTPFDLTQSSCPTANLGQNSHNSFCPNIETLRRHGRHIRDVGKPGMIVSALIY